MVINCSPSFKAHIPVVYYAKHPNTGNYVRVYKPENIRKCNRFVVQNLNGTAKNNANQDFVDFYKKYDKDYSLNPFVRSIYDTNNALVHLVTGSDVDTVNKMAKPIGIAKGEAIDRTGKSKSFETKLASHSFYTDVKSFFTNGCKRVKDDNGKAVQLAVFFNPMYGKKNNLKGFSFVSAHMVEEN